MLNGIKILSLSLVWIFLCASVVQGENTRETKAQPTFEFNNDWFAPGGKDRWLTNQMKLTVPWGDTWRFAVGNDMYTPTDKDSLEIPVGDRPWDGYTYAEAESRHRIGRRRVLRQEHIFTYRLGILGANSGTPELQKWFHNDLGFGSDPTWVGMNSSEVAGEFIYTRKNHEQISAIIGESFLTQSYGVRVGNVVDEVFLDHQFTKRLWQKVSGYAGLNGRLVFFNSHLDGRMFRKDVYTVESEEFVATARVGLIVKVFNMHLGYEYQYQTEEFEGQEDRHLFGRVLLGYNW